jgi:hypothetical protein
MVAQPNWVLDRVRPSFRQKILQMVGNTLDDDCQVRFQVLDKAR